MSDIDLNKIIVELVKEFSLPIYANAKKFGVDSLDKLKVIQNKCFTKYLKRSYERYSKTKTLLYREVPVNLKSFYIRTDLTLGSNIIKESQFINEIKKNQRIVITGTAGSGKSTFCKSIFIDLVERPEEIFPIFIELRHLNSQNGQKLYDYILNVLIELEPNFSKQQLEYSLELGKILLIFDGFDEINHEKRESYEKEIIDFANRYQNIMILVSSRPDNRFLGWEEFYQYKILPLDKEKSKSLIAKLEYDRFIKTQFLQELDEILYEKHKSFAQNPLLLTMMLLTYEQIAEIPNKIHLFYEQAFLTLFNKHDSMKSLYKRKSFSNLPLDDFKKFLSAFCIVSYSDRAYFFEDCKIEEYIAKALQISGIKSVPEHILNDLLDSVCIMQRDGLGYTFTHRSFQEYFTALFLVGMTDVHKYEVFNKISALNDRDDVIPIVFDINRELLEEEWIIPRLENLIKDFSFCESTDEGKLKMLSKMYRALTVHFESDDIDSPPEPNIAYQWYEDENHHVRFFFLLFRLYPNEFNEYFNKHKTEKTNEQLDTTNLLIENDILSAENNCLYVENINSLSKETKERIVTSNCIEYINLQVDFCKKKLMELKDKHVKRKADITDLLLGPTPIGVIEE